MEFVVMIFHVGLSLILILFWVMVMILLSSTVSFYVGCGKYKLLLVVLIINHVFYVNLYSILTYFDFGNYKQRYFMWDVANNSLF